jgi:hypothetical protein
MNKPMKNPVRRPAGPVVMIPKHYYWCLKYLSNIMGININHIIEKYLRETIKEINEGAKLKRHPKDAKHNPYAVRCIMPRELRIQAEIVKINSDLRGWELADLVRIAIRKAIDAHLDAFPELEKIVRRYDENQKNNDRKLQEQ